MMEHKDGKGPLFDSFMSSLLLTGECEEVLTTQNPL